MVIRGAILVGPDRLLHEPLHLSGGLISSEVPPADTPELELDGHLIFPGLINAHDHLQLNSIPPLRSGRPFANSYAWIDAFAAHLAEPAVAAAKAVPQERRYLQGGLKNLLGGATTVAHHDPWHRTLDDPAFPVRVLREYGWAHSLGLGLQEPPPGRPRYGPPPVESFQSTPPQWPWLIHLAEGTDSVAAAEFAKLEELQMVAENTVLVHAVGLSEFDVTRVIQRGVGVVWCPSSNLAILGSTLEARRLFDAGRLALGTDSRLTGGRDLLAELRVAAEHSDLTPREVFRLVTCDAARILRVPIAGGLQAGQRADFLVLRDGGGDPWEHLINATRSDLRAVVLGGKPVIADADLAEWFVACDLETTRVTVDAHPKLLRSSLVGVIDLESGVEMAAGHA